MDILVVVLKPRSEYDSIVFHDSTLSTSFIDQRWKIVGSGSIHESSLLELMGTCAVLDLRREASAAAITGLQRNIFSQEFLRECLVPGLFRIASPDYHEDSKELSADAQVR
ncbi:unnamed protein product [Caenorhabditis bovis]|uniref:Uncharacterized protein n=1 Tax=Caenorhabditis bovis TaxID=2654633 RepID=A0A8S1F0U6_9PELO|nr:unnamed protein product [Caenorhabditis bovis]